MPLEKFARECMPASFNNPVAFTPVMQSKRLHVQVAVRTAQSPNPVKSGPCKDYNGPN